MKAEQVLSVDTPALSSKRTMPGPLSSWFIQNEDGNMRLSRHRHHVPAKADVVQIIKHNSQPRPQAPA